MAFDPEAVKPLEDSLQRIFEESFSRKRERFAAAGLTCQIDPISRVGERGLYSSFVEATVNGPDGIPCDVAFAHIVYQAKVVIDEERFRSWADEVTDDLIKNGPQSR